MASNHTYVAFFDLDKTLLKNSSGPVLVWAAYKEGLLSSFDLIRAILLSILYKLNLKNTIKSAESMAKWLKGIPETKVEELANHLVENKLINMIRPSMIREIEHHKEKGAHLVMLSAALPYICEPLSNYLGINDVICSAMEIVDGRFTGNPIGEICISEEKEKKARQYCLDKSYRLNDAYCYGDSYSDRFVMQLTGNPVSVAPEKRLRKLAETRKWPIID